METTINTKIKELFDQVYLSRVIFEKMISLLNIIEDVNYRADILNKAKEICDSIDHLGENSDIIKRYKECLKLIHDKSDGYEIYYNKLVKDVTDFYTNLVIKLMVGVEAIRVVTKASDALYKTYYTNNILDAKPYDEFIENFNSIIIAKSEVQGNIPYSILNDIIKYDYCISSHDNTTNVYLKKDGFKTSVVYDLNYIKPIILNIYGSQYEVVGIDIDGGRSFLTSDYILCIYVDCLNNGLNYNIPIFFKLDYGVARPIDTIGTDTTKFRYLSAYVKNGIFETPFYSFISYSNTLNRSVVDNIFDVSFYGKIQPDNLIVDAGVFFVRTRYNFEKFIYNIHEANEIMIYKSNDRCVMTYSASVKFDNKIINVNNFMDGLIVLLSNGDVCVIKINNSIDRFTVNYKLLYNIGKVFSSYGDGRIGIVNNHYMYITTLSDKTKSYFSLNNFKIDDTDIGFLRGTFIPTDDFFAWYSLCKPSTVNADKCLIVSGNIADNQDFKYSNIVDPDLSNSAEIIKPNKTGNPSSRSLTHSPIINDVVVNIDGGGFCLNSINSKTGETYTRITDDYKSDMAVGTQSGYSSDTHPNAVEREVTISINEVKPYLLHIRRHAEVTKPSPSQYKAVLYNSGISFLSNNGIVESKYGPISLDPTDYIKSKLGKVVEFPKNINKINYNIPESSIFVLTNDNIVYTINLSLSRIVSVIKASDFKFTINMNKTTDTSNFRYSDGKLFINDCDTDKFYNGFYIDYVIYDIIECRNYTLFHTSDGVKICSK